MEKVRGYLFYQWPISDVKRHFDVDENNGLDTKKAQNLLEKNGPNSLTDIKKATIFTIFVRQLTNFFVLLLFVAAIISYFVDGLTQTIVLLVIIVFNILLGFFQEYKAEKTLAKLRNSLSLQSRVLRNGLLQKISSDCLVVGDVVIIEAGDKIPADLRIIEEEGLRIDESLLTGESVPVSKTYNVISIDSTLADRRNMAYSSTQVISGHGKGIVVATGTETEFGKIAAMVNTKEDSTPLEKQVLYLGRILTYLAFLMGLVIFLFGYFRGYNIFELLTFSIALLLAVVPESLPTAITLTLAIGMIRMAQKKAIVRRMAVVETLGTTNIITTDKTGTLTNNKLSVEEVYLYQKKHLAPYQIKKNEQVLDFLSYGILCSNVDVNAKEAASDPLEVAITNAAIEIDNLNSFKKLKVKRVWESPFDSNNKFMAVAVEIDKGKILVAKGATEKIIHFSNLSIKEKKELSDQAEALMQKGYKLIALAVKKISKNSSEILTSMDFLGFFAIIDEPSRGIAEVINKVNRAGIRTIIITGDHPETARFVAEKIGLSVSDDEVITNTVLENKTKSEIKKLLEKVKIIARVTPEDKINVVRLLQNDGYSVAMTGDGVNDAPALKEAQVGVAMGIRGTDVAKESADIILSDDKYATIINAIEYGRAIYDNIKNVVVQLISGNFNEIMLVFVAFVFNLPVPFITIQILWINLIIESFAALSFSFEEPSRHVLSEKPRSFSENSFAEPIRYSIYLAFASFFFGLIIYLWGLHFSVSLARTMTFTFIVASELAFSFSIRSKKRIWQSPKSFFENKYLVGSIVAALILQASLFISPFSNIFSLVKLDTIKVVVLVLATISIFMTAEVIRFIHDKKHTASSK